jgi:uncharacterized protein with PQ loop repeat
LDCRNDDHNAYSTHFLSDPSFAGFIISKRRWAIFGVNLLMIIITVVIAAIAYSISPEYKMSIPVAFANLLYFLLWWVGLLAWAVRSRRRHS